MKPQFKFYNHYFVITFFNIIILNAKFFFAIISCLINNTLELDTLVIL